MSEKIVALTVPFPGAKRPLEEGAKLGWWDLVMIDGHSVPVPDADRYVLGAWHPVYEELVDYLVTRGKVWVMWTSSVGEVDLTAVEQEYLPALVSDERIERLWFGDQSFATLYPDKGFFAWYPLDVSNPPAAVTPKHDILALFCPTGPKKNVLSQLVAIKLAQDALPELVLHTNIQQYDWILRDINHVRHGWLPAADYHQLLGQAKVNMAVSHCETYNYQVAEATLLGTPSVSSITVPMDGYKIACPNDPLEILEDILTCVEDEEMGVRCRETLIAISRRRNRETAEKMGVKG